MGQKAQNKRRTKELTFSESSVPAAFPAPALGIPSGSAGPARAASQQWSGVKAEASAEIPSSPGSAFQLPQHGLPSGFIKLGL